jgi:hypothetical protein
VERNDPGIRGRNDDGMDQSSLPDAGSALHKLPALAHKPSDSYLTVRASQDAATIDIRWDIALRDLDYVLELDRDGNGDITWGEVRRRAADIHQYAVQRLALTAGERACTWARPSRCSWTTTATAPTPCWALQARCTPGAESLRLKYSALFDVDPTHRGLVQWLAPGATGAQALVFSSESAEQSLALRGPSALETLRQYVTEGIWHIWMGYDHILFLLSLLLPAVLLRAGGRWTPVERLPGALGAVVKVVTAFTLAHSITLSLAVLGFVSLPSRFVESVIAASVVLAALNNLRGTVEKRRWVMAFVFGLVHGFGFASALADLGLPQGALALALVGFNVGVELGQLAIVAAFLPLAFWLRRTVFYRVGVLQVGSIVIAILASWWFLQRAFDL